MKSKIVSIELPAGVNVKIWQGDDETIVNGSIRAISLQIEVPLDEAAKIRKKLRGLVGQI